MSELTPWGAAILVIGYAIATLLIGIVAQDIVWRRRMLKREKELRECGVVPSGATLRHGLTIHKKTGKIRSSSEANLAWYRHLLY